MAYLFASVEIKDWPKRGQLLKHFPLEERILIKACQASYMRLDPFALKTAKIVYNFGHSEC